MANMFGFITAAPLKYAVSSKNQSNLNYFMNSTKNDEIKLP
jgi:hypothetical protein